jgi:hypothetical protein
VKRCDSEDSEAGVQAAGAAVRPCGSARRVSPILRLPGRVARSVPKSGPGPNPSQALLRVTLRPRPDRVHQAGRLRLCK